MRDEYKKLISIYNEHPALRSSGKVIPYDDDMNNVLCVERVLNNDDVLVLVNVRNAVCSMTIPPMWGGKPVTDLMTGSSIQLGKTVPLQPYQYLLLSSK